MILLYINGAVQGNLKVMAICLSMQTEGQG